MKQPKHTPGPWIVETYHNGLFKIIKELDKTKSLSGQVWTRLEADAQLISAAPEMLEALEVMVSVYSEISQLKETYAMQKAKDAIAKARGEK